MQVAEGFPGAALLHIRPPEALLSHCDHQGIARCIPQGFLISLRGLPQIPLFHPGLTDVIIENGIALPPSISVENGTGLPIPLHGLRDGIHHIVQVADGSVQGGAGVINFFLRIAARIGRRDGTARHPLHGRKRLPVIDHGTIVLLIGPKALADIAAGIGIGLLPASGFRDGKRLACIEHAFLAIQGAVPEHEVPVGPVQRYQVCVGSLVHRIRRPACDGALK